MPKRMNPSRKPARINKFREEYVSERKYAARHIQMIPDPIIEAKMPCPMANRQNPSKQETAVTKIRIFISFRFVARQLFVLSCGFLR